MKKCPICELNYVSDNATMCDVCKERLQGKKKPRTGKAAQPKINAYTAVTDELQAFWGKLSAILEREGNPFSINHEYGGKTVFWALVNRRTAKSPVALYLDFSLQKSFFRVSLYIEDNLRLYERLLEAKDDIESMLRVPVLWEDGVKGSDTKRIAYYLPMKPYVRGNYDDLLEKAFPVILDFFEVAKKYARFEFFDF